MRNIHGSMPLGDVGAIPSPARIVGFDRVTAIARNARLARMRCFRKRDFPKKSSRRRWFIEGLARDRRFGP